MATPNLSMAEDDLPRTFRRDKAEKEAREREAAEAAERQRAETTQRETGMPRFVERGGFGRQNDNPSHGKELHKAGCETRGAGRNVF